MRYIKPYNEAKKWTLDELFVAMKHPFLEGSFIKDIFSDVIDCGYSLGFKGYYKHDWIFPDGYNTISNDKDIHKRYQLKGFNLAFYKDLDVETSDYRPISEIKEELTAFENSITQYLNQPEFDDEYEFVGIHIEIDGDPNARNLQRVSLKFINKSTKQTPLSTIYNQD
jgi:hypothetical protein